MATTTRSTTTSTTTYNLSTYRYQQDEPGVLRPSVPTSVWTNHPATNPPTLRVSTEITRAANGSGGSGGVGAFESVIIKVLDGNRGGRGGIAVLV